MKKPILRRARPADAHSFFHLKERLPIPADSSETSKGGFLLGTTVDQYTTYINDAHCIVAEDGGEVIGFGIIIPDEMLRKTDIWTKRHNVDWNIPLETYERVRLSYFEQLAFLPNRRRLAVQLAYNLVKEVFNNNTQALFTTTVNKPIKNLAAIPFIKAANGIHAGNIDEYYPVVGAINSDIYIIDRSSFEQALKTRPSLSFLEQAY